MRPEPVAFTGLLAEIPVLMTTPPTLPAVMLWICNPVNVVALGTVKSISKITLAAVMFPVMSRVTRTVTVENPLVPGALTGGTSLSGDMTALNTVVSWVSAQTQVTAVRRNAMAAQSFLIFFLAWTEFDLLIVFCCSRGERTLSLFSPGYDARELSQVRVFPFKRKLSRRAKQLPSWYRRGGAKRRGGAHTSG